MTAAVTRLLMLGAVSLFEPVNGYQIRRELLSWDVDDWAHIRPGSIYSSLGTLTRQGHVERHDLVDGNREVAVYTSTDAGRAELATLFRECIEQTPALDPVPLNAAMSLCALFDRKTVTGHLENRSHALVVQLAELEAKHSAAASGIAPPQVVRMLELQLATVRVELEWVEALVVEIRSGGLMFAGEPMTWTPAPDDPGWQMHAERERYKELLARP